MYWLVESYKIEEIKKMIKETPELVNELDKTKDETTPLMVSVWNGDTENVKLLVNCENIDINKKDSAGQSAIFYCLLTKEGNQLSEEMRVTYLRILLDSGKCDIYGFHEIRNHTLLMIAAQLGDDVCLAEILKAGYSPYRAEDNDVEKIIKKHFAAKDDSYADDDDDDDDSSCGTGSSCVDSDSDDVLFPNRRRKYKYSYIKDDLTPIKMFIHLTNRSFDRKTYKTFYKKNFRKSIDFFDYLKGRTALMHCLRLWTGHSVEEKLSCIKLLIEAGASIDVEDSQGKGPMDLAVNRCCPVDVSIIRYLISIGCKYNLEYHFLQAAKWMYVDIMKIFIELGADPTKTNGQSKNLLHYFFSSDYKESIYYVEERKEQRQKMLHYLIHDLNVDMNAKGSDSIFALAFIHFLKGVEFPLLYLVSENIDYNILNSDTEVEQYHSKFQDTMDHQLFDNEDKIMDEYQLLYNIGVPYDISCKLHDCEHFEGENEQRDETKEWLKEILDKPDTLARISRFKIRKLLGADIKTKVPHLHLPGPLKDKILMKDILPADCFEENW